MRCLRIYASPDGESHFDEGDIPMEKRRIFTDAELFELSAHYPASRIRFTRIPAGLRQVSRHTVPERVLTVRLDGSVEYGPVTERFGTFPPVGFVLIDMRGIEALRSWLDGFWDETLIAFKKAAEREAAKERKR